ncbi:hypothetical protein M407DRAFT_68288 [Tulasnella calospora MUT 4182]|uniref:Uncharacterized protein n=1 Tax=Tulasnella calospora MUT 4182 TaxID=1051891 RepID=A0A0C3MBR8_9AGAM|nr:hypothetical protein M407DRAFT_68288 [Tulasnella calospora MUT 4182]
MEPTAGPETQEGVYGHPDNDEIVSSIPIHISRSLAPHIHLHQFPLLTRPLEVPESARVTGKRMKARAKPEAGRYEIHAPVDTRSAMWNAEQAKEYGAARVEEDAEERRLEGRRKYESDEDEEEEKKKNAKTLKETRLRSERVKAKGDYFVGVLRDGQLYLHPISQVHQFRPTLTYMDVLSRKNRPKTDDDDDVEEESAPPAAAATVAKAAREVVVAARGTPGEAAGNVGGLSALRRDMISTMRKEQEERWVDMQWDDEKAPQTSEIFESLFSATSNDALRCTSKLSDVLTGIKGLTKVGVFILLSKSFLCSYLVLLYFSIVRYS